MPCASAPACRGAMRPPAGATIEQISKGGPAAGRAIQALQSVHGEAVVRVDRQHAMVRLNGAIVVGHLVFGQARHLQGDPHQLFTVADGQTVGENEIQAFVIVGEAIALLEEVEGLAVARIEGSYAAQVAFDPGVIALSSGDSAQRQTHHRLGGAVAVAHSLKAHAVEFAICGRVTRGRTSDQQTGAQSRVIGHGLDQGLERPLGQFGAALVDAGQVDQLV